MLRMSPGSCRLPDSTLDAGFKVSIEFAAGQNATRCDAMRQSLLPHLHDLEKD